MIPKFIILHHTASSRDRTSEEDVENWHKVRFPISSLGSYIGYHYLILGNGQIIQARRDNEIGMHSIPNDGKIGIALCGNFTANEVPSDAQLNSLEQLLNKLKSIYNLQNKDIFAHRELNKTECPGDNLMKWILLKRQLSILQKIILLLKRKLGILTGKNEK